MYKNTTGAFKLFGDNANSGILDTRKLVSKNTVEAKLPESISGTYTLDYNILHVDSVIRKKLLAEKNKLSRLENKLKELIAASNMSQTQIMREATLEAIEKTRTEIRKISSQQLYKNYDKLTSSLLEKYRDSKSQAKTLVFGQKEEQFFEIDKATKERLIIIDQYLEIAREYMPLNVIRVNNQQRNVCPGCGTSLIDVEPSDNGCIICPNQECQTVNNVIITTKCGKDGQRVHCSSRSEDDSIDNFMKALNRYQGLQQFKPDDGLFDELDKYFVSFGRPTGAEVRAMDGPGIRGKKAGTAHKMLLEALSAIGRTSYYEDANLIGHLYWGWPLPIVDDIDTIVEHYNKTQKVFRQIPLEERDRCSSLGTQYRLWRHLQLVGHECYADEFKVAENWESLLNHDKLWELMCKGTDDPNIRYIK